MSYLRDTAIVLTYEPFREHDAWVTLFGREHGKLVAVARGCRVPKAKQIGHLEPFSKVDVMIAKGQAFDKLAVARSLGSSRALRQSLPALVLAGSTAHLVEQLTRPGLPESDIFFVLEEIHELAGQGIQGISANRTRLLANAAAVRILLAQGLMPTLDACGQCQAELVHESWWSPLAHGFVCKNCIADWRHDQGLRLMDVHGRRLVRMLASWPLKELLTITIPLPIVILVSSLVEDWVQRTPLGPGSFDGSRFSRILDRIDALRPA